MKLKYRYLSYGYIGIPKNKSTINSRFYAELLPHDTSTWHEHTELLMFPQRTPRSDFFQELDSVEGRVFALDFGSRTTEIKLRFKRAVDELLKYRARVAARNVINWMNILLRHGGFSEIMKEHRLREYHGPCWLEIALIIECSYIEGELSKGNNISLSKLVALEKSTESGVGVTARERVLLLNKLIVYHCRYDEVKPSSESLGYYEDELVSALERMLLTPFQSAIYRSVSYRGLAMLPYLSDDLVSEYLAQAMKWAERVCAKSKLQELIKADNQFTLLQTMAKWEISNKQFGEAGSYLRQLVKIDPYDSTGYSELGFFYLSQECHKQAKLCFKKAYKLGPPGIGMNCYYFAKCFEFLGRLDRARFYMRRVTVIDANAISPWLDLLEYSMSESDDVISCNIIMQILSNSVLKEQLEPGELEYIQDILTSHKEKNNEANSRL